MLQGTIQATDRATVQRSMDVAFWNAVANDPDVRPHIGGDGIIDLSTLVLNPANYCLRTDSGGFICQNHGGGSYSVHSLFLAEGRSRTSAAVRAGQDFMFTRTDCSLLWSQLPDSNAPAAHLGVVAGFEPWFRKESCPILGPSTIGRIPVDSWITGPNGGYLANEGHDFHNRLEAAKAAAGSFLPVHPEDETHDRYVGAALLMCKRGQAAKGVFLYNNWAIAAGYAQIEALSLNPPVVDVGDGIVGLDAAGELEILLCR